MSGWRVLDLNGADGSIKYRDGSLVVSTSRTQMPVLIGVVDTAVVLVGTAVTISAEAVAAVADKGASIVVCDWKNEPVAALAPWSSHTRVGARQRAQLSATVPQQKRVWGDIIRSKISGQAWALRSQGHMDAKHLKTMSEKVASGDTSNMESAAAAYYWRRFNGGMVRDRASGDPVNSALNYGYTVLRSRALNAVVAAGLHPGIGVFHHNHANPWTRPRCARAIDHFLAALIRRLSCSGRVSTYR